MPLRDGLGPPNGGPREGRRLGWCRSLVRKPAARNTLWSAALISLGAAIVKDLSHPNSNLRRIFHTVVDRISGHMEKTLGGGRSSVRIDSRTVDRADRIEVPVGRPTDDDEGTRGMEINR
ncbi:MAG: hypothetical protein V2A56_10225 [bacterium]